MTTLNVRIEEATKAKAAKVFENMGLDMSSAVKLFLHQVVKENGLPFTPTNNPALIRARWDKQVAAARKSGTAYATGKEALADL